MAKHKDEQTNRWKQQWFVASKDGRAGPDWPRTIQALKTINNALDAFWLKVAIRFGGTS
jgi:hypothetical protein